MESVVSGVFLVKEKNAEIFNEIANTEHGVSPSEVYVVGDRIEDEIRFGNMNGFTTIWFKKGKYSGIEPKEAICVPDKITTTASQIEAMILN